MAEQTAQVARPRPRAGGAHFTQDRGERAQTEPVVRCAETVVWMVNPFVYAKLGIDPPRCRVWTAA